METSILHIARAAARHGRRGAGPGAKRAKANVPRAGDQVTDTATGSQTVTVVPSRRRLSIFRLP